MKAIRANLTRLKSLAEEKLPDEPDIFGFAGISKELIVRFINEAHELSYSLAGLEPKFEITILKRKITHLLESCKDSLSDGLTGWSKDKKFDEFLSNLTRIRDEIRFTYLVVVDKALRTEEATNAILQDHEKLAAAYTQYEESFKTIAENHEVIQKARANADSASAGMTEHLDAIKKAAEEVSARAAEASASFEITSKYENEIKEKRQYMTDQAVVVESLSGKAETLLSSAEAEEARLKELAGKLGEQMSINERQQKEIQDTLDIASRLGMAGSFKARKDELDTPIRMWGGVFGLAVLLIFGVAWYFVTPYLDTREDVDYVGLLVKVALVSPFVWLAWMSVKQYGYLSRIREDYAYKYASALAFEGYKKEAKEIEQELLRRLLAVSVENLSQNPIRLFRSKEDHVSPANELLGRALAMVKRAGGTADKDLDPTA